MSDPLASTLAELRRRLEAEEPSERDRREPAAARTGDSGDLWQFSEMELDRAMGRRLEELHELLPPEPAGPPSDPSLADRLRRRLGVWIQGLMLPFSAPQRALEALLTELGLATYIRHRRQEERQDELADRIAGLEEDVALLRRQLADGGSTERELSPGE
jgi:hypothetical protein